MALKSPFAPHSLIPQKYCANIASCSLRGETSHGRHHGGIAVAHDAYKEMGAAGIDAVVKPGRVVVDVKAVFAVSSFFGRII
jgi:hypothetical protein